MELFKDSKIGESSKKLYLSNLKRLGYTDNLSVFDDYESIVAKLPEKPTTRRSYVISIVAALKATRPDFKESPYYALMMEMNKQLKHRPEKSQTQTENWLDKELVLRTQASKWSLATSKIKKNTKHLKEGQYTPLYDAVVLSLYTLMPPRRNLDFVLMKQGACPLTPDAPFGSALESGVNWYHNGKFYMNNYKTKGTYKTQVIDVPPALQEVLNVWLRFKKPSEWLLVDEDGKNMKTSTDMTRTLNRIFEKPVGCSLLRSIFITEKHGKALKELKKDTSDMGTSVDVAIHHYNKV